MNNQDKNNIFRKESLDRLSSPERLDQLMNIVGRQDWLPLSTLGFLVFLGILWSLFGKIPVNVTSKGVLIMPRRVVNIQSPLQGQLKQLKVQPGYCLKKDEVIATIDPFETRQKLELEKEKLAQLQGQEQQATTLQIQRTKLEIQATQQEQISKKQRLEDALKLSPILKEREIQAIEQERISVNKQLANIQSLNPILKEKTLKSIETQKINLQQQLEDAQTLSPLLKERTEKRRSLLDEGAISSEQVLEAEQEYKKNLQEISKLRADLKQLETQKTEAEQKYLDNLDVIAKYQAKLRELDIKETETQQKYLENLSTISQLKAELQELDTQIKILEQDNLKASTDRQNEIQAVKHNIAQFQKQVEFNQKIKSPYDGCILEVTKTNNAFLNLGDNIASIKVNDSSEEIASVAYFPVGEGKKIKPGMNIYITPDTVRREQFGGIVGEVNHVSVFPITKQGATNLIGNPEVVEELIAKVGPVIAVQAKLHLDPATPSGYQWSSSNGPQNLQITSGTTTIARVTIEKQTPITLILPILREWSGIYHFSER
ncbi:MAG: NHLP bacteriocin system secretion protein [Crocosphaera sp.]|nr:NHLP bacteriocin system secretion protein [Crocosphaera sp.]